jgi:hypothetical protein
MAYVFCAHGDTNGSANVIVPQFFVTDNGGMCVLSRFPIVDVINKPIPHSYCNALVGACVLWRKRRWWCFSIHLDSRRYKQCEDQRHHELEWIGKQTYRFHNVILVCVLFFCFLLS